MTDQIHSGAMPYPKERRLNLRLPGELCDQLTVLAAKEDRSVNAEIVNLLLEMVALREWHLEAQRRAREWERRQ